MFNTQGLIAVLILALINAKTAVTENDYYAGLRKPPQQITASTNYEDYILSQWKNIIDEQARRRFQQQRQKQKQFAYANGDDSDANGNSEHDALTDDVSGPGFTYKLPVHYSSFGNEFAVGPENPKFYEKNPNTERVMAEAAAAAAATLAEGGSLSKSDAPMLTYRNVLNSEADSVHLNSDGIPTYKVKAPMNINPKIIPYDYASDTIDNSYEQSKSQDVLTREDIQKLVENLQRNGQGKAIVNVLQPFTQSMQQNDVAKKPVDLNSAWVVAVIAGVSAALTVGLLAIGIGWYTLQKKAKAAADVDYPAYGITGPNKDVSPSSGDRRLAQSAQMYHYQHQKNQIIAMENQNSGEQNGSLSDIETDEENEEGDYTVYECPGLAPTGDMEVKNPLFLDDPTPVKKNAAVKESQAQRPTKTEQSNDDAKASHQATKN